MRSAQASAYRLPLQHKYFEMLPLDGGAGGEEFARLQAAIILGEKTGGRRTRRSAGLFGPVRRWQGATAWHLTILALVVFSPGALERLSCLSSLQA